VIKKSEVIVDKAYEAGRGAFRMQAQEWAGLEVDPEAQLFVFVGRWSEQKGVDLIADIFPSILEDYPKSQLICVGPVIDLYGKFAALKLSKLMEQYPKRVFSRPEFTMLPPYIHTGAEFALIPSRDEPFGLVAVEFGRKGALGVGARVGGLGQMPGWWYTIESMSSTHLLKQFKLAIVSALESKDSERALMRAWSAKQRFPVAQWLEGLSKLQDQAVQLHDKHNKASTSTPRHSIFSSSAHPQTPPGGHSRDASGPPPLPMPASSRASSIHEADPELGRNDFLAPVRPSALSSTRSSVVNLGEIVGQRKDFALQQVDPFFTDSDEEFYNKFARMLDELNARNSTTELCTEEYIVESTRVWFSRRHDAKYGINSLFSSANSSAVFLPKKTQAHAREVEPADNSEDGSSTQGAGDHAIVDEKGASHFDFGENFVQPTGLRKYLQVKVGTWPVYSFLLALGQIIASNSYQITLLTGEIGQSAEKLYAIAGIYLAFSIIWGVLTRYVKLLHLLTIPFFFYGLAFLLVGTSPFMQNLHSRFWMQNVATGFYAAASASGSLFFAFNFGDEGKLSLSPISYISLLTYSKAVHRSQSGFGEHAGSKRYSMRTPWLCGSGAASSAPTPQQARHRSASPLSLFSSQSPSSSRLGSGLSVLSSTWACPHTTARCLIRFLRCSGPS
jgi:alpha-1,3-glucan synthase